MTGTPELKEAVEEIKTAFEEFKSANDAILAEKADKGTVDPILTDKLEKLQDTLDEKSKLLDTATAEAAAEQKTQGERMDALETALNRSPTNPVDQKSMNKLRLDTHMHLVTCSYESGGRLDITPADVSDEDMKAFEAYSDNFHIYIRKGADRFLKEMDNFETKLLSVDRDPGGGYFVSPELSGKIVEQVFESSPIRQFARVETIATDALEILTDLNEAGSGWVGEQESRAETDTPDVGKRIIPAHELQASPRATQKLLDDAGFNVESWLAGKVSSKFSRDEATAFVTGNGVNKPRGFLTYDAGTSITTQIEQINSGAAGEVVADGLYKLIYGIKSPYLRNARFMAARLTIRDLRLLKDGQSRYLWEPNFQVGQPQMIAGYPIHQADDMPAIAGDSLSIAFGDFSEAYVIVDRKGIRVLRDPFTAKPYVVFYTTKRVGGDMMNFEAIKLQKLAA